MSLMQRKAKHCALLALFFGSLVLAACISERSSVRESAPKTPGAAEVAAPFALPLLESFGIETRVFIRDLAVPMPTGKTQNAVSLRCLQVEMVTRNSSELQKLVPLYATHSTTRVNFFELGQGYLLSDLLSPAAQAALNHEFQFDPKAAKLSSTEALFAVLQSEGSNIRFVSYADSQLDSFLLSPQAFKSFGSVPLVRNSSAEQSRERNSGFAVGDVLVFQVDGRVKHSAVWIDHDLYLEALVFARSVLFRLSSWSQLIEELALRNNDDLRKMKATALRRMGSWSETVSRTRKFRAQSVGADILLGLDSRGRGRVTSASGVAVIPRLREPTDGGASRQGNQR